MVPSRVLQLVEHNRIGGDNGGKSIVCFLQSQKSSRDQFKGIIEFCSYRGGEVCAKIHRVVWQAEVEKRKQLESERDVHGGTSTCESRGFEGS